jgi:hypothetical protein
MQDYRRYMKYGVGLLPTPLYGITLNDLGGEEMKKKYLMINEGKIHHLNLKEGFNKIYGKDLDKMIKDAEILEPIQDDDYHTISIDLVVRSTHTNEVLMIDGEISRYNVVKEHFSNSKEYWLVLANLQEMLRDNFIFDDEFMRNSTLMPLGVIRSVSDVSILYALILEDKDFNLLKPRNNITPYSLAKIEELNLFTNNGEKTSIILPTLNIVRSDKKDECDKRCSDTRKSML